MYPKCLNFEKKNIYIYIKGTNKDKWDPTYYRGITLTSVVSKLYEKIILSRIVKNDFAYNNVKHFHIICSLGSEVTMVSY